MTTVKVETIDLAAFSRRTRRACLRVCAKVTRKYARQEAPKGKKGKIRSKMQYGMLRDNSYVTSKAPHAHLILNGVKPHPIFTTKAHGRLFVPMNDTYELRKGPFQHPGLPANDYLGRGLERARGEIAAGMTNIVDKPGEMAA